MKKIPRYLAIPAIAILATMIVATMIVPLCVKTPTEQDIIVNSIIRDMVSIPGQKWKIGKHEVSLRQWSIVMETGEEIPKYTICGVDDMGRPIYKNVVTGEKTIERPTFDDHPVANVSWNDCQVFLKKLNAMPVIAKSGLVFRLPTESEWVFAFRAGANDKSYKDDSGRIWDEEEALSWCLIPGLESSQNAFGLCDMLGNVREWTSSSDGSFRVVCGGSFWNPTDNPSLKFSASPVASDCITGFRLCADRR